MESCLGKKSSERKQVIPPRQALWTPVSAGFWFPLPWGSRLYTERGPTHSVILEVKNARAAL